MTPFVVGILLAAAAPRTAILEIADHKMSCIGEMALNCMLVTEQGAKPGQQELFHDGIKGFRYLWGRSYTLEVTVTTVEQPPADGSSLRYELVKVVSETPAKAGTCFEYGFDRHLVASTSPTAFTIEDGVNVTCASAAECTKLLASIPASEPLMGTLCHTGTTGELKYRERP